MHIYHESRYRARKKYYEKEENKEKKRVYMRERYAKNKIKNEDLNTINSERFINYEKETRQ
jgi:hypothetical protein